MTADTTNDDRGQPPDALHAMLRAGARGHLPSQAAVDLLADHGTWPERLFQAGHVVTWTATAAGPAVAAIDWRAVADRLTDQTGRGFAASSSELSILAVTASLAGHFDVRLGDLLPRLDATNTRLGTPTARPNWSWALSRRNRTSSARSVTELLRILRWTSHPGLPSLAQPESGVHLTGSTPSQPSGRSTRGLGRPLRPCSDRRVSGS